MRALLALLLPLSLFAQAPPAFDVASLKVSPRLVGKDYNNQITITPAGITAHNVTLKRLIGEAYGLQPFAITGGPAWLDSAEYELEAKAAERTGRQQIDRMLQSLLAERFHLTFHKDAKEMKVYHLVVDKGGPKIQPVDASAGKPAGPGFTGDLQEFANFLSVQFSIPIADDPARPGIASGTPTPVIDKTGLAGTYQFSGLARPEPGTDPFVLWQRTLREQFGLRLENARDPVDVLVVDHAEKVPAGN